MITEDYCSYEVAKLLKDKGFDEICTLAYEELNQLKVMMNWRVASGYLPCPTHQTAMKWLREEHGFHISVAPYLNNEGEVTWVWEIINIETATVIADSLDNDDFDSCEEAVETALKYCLTELI